VQRMIALMRTAVRPSRSLEALSALDSRWRGAIHPFGVALVLCSAVLALLMNSVPNLSEWSGRALWVLVTGFVAFGASAAVVSLWPPSPAGLRQLRKTRNRLAGQFTARVRSSSPRFRVQLEALRTAALERIDNDILPAFSQMVLRDAGVTSEIRAYNRSSAEPNDEVLARLQLIHEQYASGTQACAQRAVDAEARLFVLLQERDDAALEAGLSVWIGADLGHVTEALGYSLSVPLAWARPPEPTTSAAGVSDHSSASINPQPADFVDLTRRALRALNKPATLAKSALIGLLPLSLDEVWQQSGRDGSGDRSPLEQSQALRAVLLHAIEQLNVAAEGSAQAHQYEVLRRQYVMGQNVAQVGMRLGIAEPGVYRRSAEGVDAVAVDLWRREQLLAAERG
jgi:hypothetical protein